MKLQKFDGNPILTANPANDWEKYAVLNPGAIVHDGKVHMLYRASGETEAYRITIGLAVSDDGLHFERASDQPVLGLGDEGDIDHGCVEDARVTHTDGWYYMTYACRAWPPGLWWGGHRPATPLGDAPSWTENLSRTGLARARDLRSWEKLGPITADDVDDRDAILFPERINGKWFMLHRPMTWWGEGYPCEGPSIWITSGDEPGHWGEEHLLAKAEQEWEGGKIGGSTPPMKTDQGWLTLFHGVDTGGVYRVGVMMLDLADPRRVIARAPGFLIEPEAEWERVGHVPNVCFPCGQVVLGDTLHVYYGGADSVVCVATCGFKELIDHVMRFRQ